MVGPQSAWAGSAGSGRMPLHPRPQMHDQFELRNSRSNRHTVTSWVQDEPMASYLALAAFGKFRLDRGEVAGQRVRRHGRGRCGVGGEPGERRRVKIQVSRPNTVVRAKTSYVIKQKPQTVAGVTIHWAKFQSVAMASRRSC